MKRITFYSLPYADHDSRCRAFAIVVYITKTSTIEIGIKIWRWETGIVIWLDGEQ